MIELGNTAYMLAINPLASEWHAHYNALGDGDRKTSTHGCHVRRLDELEEELDAAWLRRREIIAKRHANEFNDVLMWRPSGWMEPVRPNW